MTSTIWAFLRIFGPRAARTSTKPNSQAVVSLWQRFFELQDRQEEERLEEIVQVLEELEGIAAPPPIQSERAISVRAAALSDHYRQMFAGNHNNNNRCGNAPVSPPAVNSAAAPATGITARLTTPQERVMNQPNLGIPAGNGNDFMYLAQ